MATTAPAAGPRAHHAHVIQTPKWLLGLRIAQIVLAVVIMGLVAYSASKVFVSTMESAYGLNLFTCAATLIIVTWLLVSLLAVPAAYNMWAQLAVEIFLTLMWLVSFAVLANYTASFYIISSSTYYYGSFFKRSEPGYIPWETGAAAAGLGGLEFILFVITLIFFALGLHRHRLGGANRSAAATTGPAGGPVTHEQKYAAGPGQEAGPPTVQPVHHQQPVQAQQPAHAHQPAPMSHHAGPEQTYSSAPEAVNPSYPSQ
ncbi:MAG: hypothetical protein M1832_004064 [Thelocarpon impressellum]|nr:MAG: hypothetical protein M1832_004064 [Thelocarpon impressellum]